MLYSFGGKGNLVDGQRIKCSKERTGCARGRPRHCSEARHSPSIAYAALDYSQALYEYTDN